MLRLSDLPFGVLLLLAPAASQAATIQLSDFRDFESTTIVSAANETYCSDHGAEAACSFQPYLIRIDSAAADEVGRIFGNDPADQFTGLRNELPFDHLELQHIDEPQSSSANRFASQVDFGLNETGAEIWAPAPFLLMALGLVVLLLRRCAQCTALLGGGIRGAGYRAAGSC